MALQEELERQGNWLFRKRSYLPLLLLPLLVVAAYSSESKVEISAGFYDELWTFISLLIAFGGLGIRLYVIGHVPSNTSGRNTSRQRAETLNTAGLYSIVRHPLYLGNFIIILGISLSLHVWWFPLVTILIFGLYYERIMFAEEEFLRKKFGSTFLKWAAQTPAFFPKFHLWKSPFLPFSLRTVLGREYSGFFGIIVAFTVIELIKELITKRILELSAGWIIFFSIGGLVYLVLRTLKKKTRLFQVEGR